MPKSKGSTAVTRHSSRSSRHPFRSTAPASRSRRARGDAASEAGYEGDSDPEDSSQTDKRSRKYREPSKGHVPQAEHIEHNGGSEAKSERSEEHEHHTTVPSPPASRHGKTSRSSSIAPSVSGSTDNQRGRARSSLMRSSAYVQDREVDGNTLNVPTVKDNNVSLIDRQALSEKHASAAASRSGSLARSVSSLAKLEKRTVDEPTNAARGNSQKGIDASSISKDYPLPKSRASSSVPSTRSLAKAKEPRVDKSGSEAGGNCRKAIDELSKPGEGPPGLTSRSGSAAPSARSVAKGREPRREQSRNNSGSLPRSVSSQSTSRDHVSATTSRSGTPASSVTSLAKRKDSRVDIARSERGESRTRDIDELLISKDRVPASTSRSSTRAPALDRLPADEELGGKALERERGSPLLQHINGEPVSNEAMPAAASRSGTLAPVMEAPGEREEDRARNSREEGEGSRRRDNNASTQTEDPWINDTHPKEDYGDNRKNKDKLEYRRSKVRKYPLVERKKERLDYGKYENRGADIIRYKPKDDKAKEKPPTSNHKPKDVDSSLQAHVRPHVKPMYKSGRLRPFHQNDRIRELEGRR